VVNLAVLAALAAREASPGKAMYFLATGMLHWMAAVILL
jgi:hypothetical protein